MLRLKLVLPLAGALTAPTSLGAQVTAAPGSTDVAAVSDPVYAEPDAIVVTGSRGPQRTATDGPSPIDVLPIAEIERTGRAGVLQALNTLIPSFNSPARAGGSTATIIATGGLRGLNPDQTLVLVNGKRRHKTSLINANSSLFIGSVPSDLDLIPTSAIGRIEVLREGAAAQYGSDAIAGVINVILKRDRQGGSATFTAGQNYGRGDGELFHANGNIGLPIGTAGYLDLSATARKQQASNRARALAPDFQLYPRIGGQPDPREATIDRLVTRNYGAFPQRSLLLGYNLGYDFGGFEVYSFGTFGQRRSDLNLTYRAPTNPVTLPEVFPDGFRPRLLIREDDFEIAIGARVKVAGFDADLSSTYGGNEAEEDVDRTLNASLGPTSPNAFYVGTLRSREWVNSLDLTRGFDVGGNLQLSLGAQHRRETYSIQSGDPASYAAGSYVIPAGQGNAGARPAPGSQGAVAFQPDDAGAASRNNYAAYAELAYDPNDRITLGIAGRFEHYDDASGDTAIGRANARFAATDWLALRGTASTGFRAPGLAQHIYAATTGQFRQVNGVLNLLSIKTLRVDSPAAIALGAEPLEAEKSVNFSAGLVLEPVRGLAITVDAYQISVDDRIAITSTLTGPAVARILVANGQLPDISAQYFTNAIDTRTRGIDVVATYRANLGGLGQMRFNAGYNYNKTRITNVIDNPSELDSLSTPAQTFVLFDRLTRGNLTRLAPRTKLSLSDAWTIGALTLNARLVRYGGYVIPQNIEANDRRFGAKWIADLEASYDFGDRFNLAVGANNLFDTYPDENGIFNVPTGSQQYGASPPSPFGFTGGFYYARAGVTF